MSVCFSYLTRFWRRKSAVLGFLLLGLCILLFVHSYHHKSLRSPNTAFINPNYYGHDHHAGENIFVSAGSKKLQQSSVISPEEEGVKFLPLSRKPINGIKYKVHPNVVSDEKRRAVAAKHRQVLPAPQHIIVSSLNEKFQNGAYQEIPVSSDLDGGDFEQQPAVYLNPPNFRGDHGPELPEEQSENDIMAKPIYVPNQRLVHLDLKGAPPKIEFLRNFLQKIKDWGATGVLIEYEDMFPFEGLLKDVAALNHYNKSDLYNFLITSKQLGLEVIPLVQTFGHMEFILKHGQFANLRDSPQMPESICPCHEHTMNLIEKYIDQVMAIHRDAHHIHIGCDEVFHLGECSACAGQSRTDLFVNHVANVAKYVKTKYPHIQSVIIWDDMLRNLMAAEMMPLKNLVVPMVWVYAEDVYRFMPSYNWDRLSEVFPTAWTASAYKGAEGPTAAVPNVNKRLTNNLNWLDLMASQETKFKNNGFQGIVLTGWSRYDHFAVLAELLPAAIPSLVTNLITVTHGYFNSTWQSELYKKLDCHGESRLYEDFIDLESDPLLHEKMSWCFFKGAPIFKLTHNLATVQNEVSQYLQKYSAQEGWLTEYNMRHNYSSPFRVNEGLDEHARISYLVNALIKQAQTSLTEVYDEYTVSEWIEQKVYPLYKDLNDFKVRAESLKLRSTWPRRPFPVLKAVQDLLAPSTTTTTPKSSVQINIQSKIIHKNSNFMHSQDNIDTNTVRPKRLVQAPDYYRHPPGSF